VSIHHGGGVGIGRSIHAGRPSSVSDGTPLCGDKLERLPHQRPAMSIIRHVDAGYDVADRTADEQGVRMPIRMGPNG
jgi:urocanate hydratase